jgi:hypothetical protein
VVAREEGVKGGAEKPWKRRRRVYSQTGPALDRRPIENDPAFKAYISKLNKPEKPLARASYLDCVGAAYSMLKSMGILITDHSITKLVKRKEENPKDMSIEKALTVLKSTPTIRTNTVHASRMVGLFKANFVPLSIHIWVKSGRPTKPIQESVLRAIRQDPELQQIHYDLLDLMAYSGERVQALAMTPPQDISFVEGTETAIISVSPARSKTATEHPSPERIGRVPPLGNLNNPQLYALRLPKVFRESLLRQPIKLRKPLETHLRLKVEWDCELVSIEANPPMKLAANLVNAILQVIHQTPSVGDRTPWTQGRTTTQRLVGLGSLFTDTF